MKNFIKYLIFILLVVVVGVGFYKKIYIPKHTFKTVMPKKGDMSVKVNGIGNVGAKDIYKVGSLYGGKLYDFTVEEGDTVKKGEIVAKVDSVDLSNKIAEQKALIEKLKVDIEGLKIDKKSAEVNYAYQLDLFKKNFRLYKLHSISSLDFKKYKTLKDTAKLKIKSLEAHINSLYKQILQIKENIKGMQKRLSYFTVISPISGYVIKKLAVNHQMIMPNFTLFEVVNPKDVWVQTYIDTRISGQVKISDKATIKLRSSDKLYKGKVVDINPINNPVTYEREIDVRFDHLPLPFYMEEQAIVQIYTNKLKNVIKIPSNALVFYKERDGVWVLNGDKVSFKPVKILARSKNEVAIKGIKLQDKLVLPNPKKVTLKEGMKIYHD